MMILKPELRNDGFWWVRWLFGCIQEDRFDTEPEAEKYRDDLLKEFAEMECEV